MNIITVLRHPVIVLGHLIAALPGCGISLRFITIDDIIVTMGIGRLKKQGVYGLPRFQG